MNDLKVELGDDLCKTPKDRGTLFSTPKETDGFAVTIDGDFPCSCKKVRVLADCHQDGGNFFAYDTPVHLCLLEDPGGCGEVSSFT